MNCFAGNIQISTCRVYNVGDSTAAARLKDIEGRLQDEVQALERLIAKAPPNGGQP